MLRFMGSQRVGHENDWTEVNQYPPCVLGHAQGSDTSESAGRDSQLRCSEVTLCLAGTCSVNRQSVLQFT